jgi:hypothetical protein
VTECMHCERVIVPNPDDAPGLYQWIDPEATGDDSIWRESCDAHDTFIANHEPRPVFPTAEEAWAEAEAYRAEFRRQRRHMP